MGVIEQNKLRIGIVGPMLGSNPGWVMSQGEIITEHFRAEGYPVHTTSTYPNRWLRLADTVSTIRRWQGQVDVVAIMVFSGAAFVMTDVASLVAQRLNVPLIFWLHGGNLPIFSKKYPRWVTRVMGRANYIVTPSGYLADSVKRLGFSASIIPNLLKVEQYPYRLRGPSRPKLLWMRTFHEIYNPHLAVEAVAILRNTFPDITLTMAGQDKGLLDSTRSYAEQLGIADHVQFAGFLDVAGKQREFANHDIYLHTNRVDNTPVSVLEAGAFGLPMVATNVGGIPYLLNEGKTALMVPSEDAAAMAAAVTRLLQDAELCRQLSTNARTLAEGCAWAQIKQDWDEVFEHLLA